METWHIWRFWCIEQNMMIAFVSLSYFSKYHHWFFSKTTLKKVRVQFENLLLTSYEFELLMRAFGRINDHTSWKAFFIQWFWWKALMILFTVAEQIVRKSNLFCRRIRIIMLCLYYWAMGMPPSRMWSRTKKYARTAYFSLFSHFFSENFVIMPLLSSYCYYFYKI